MIKDHVGQFEKFLDLIGISPNLKDVNCILPYEKLF